MYDKDEVRLLARKYTDLVRQECDPLRVLLFGSYVNGNPHEYSDIDIAVVFKDYKGDWDDAWARLFVLTRNVSLDIEPHILDESDDPLGFVEHIMETGEVIYERKL